MYKSMCMYDVYFIRCNPNNELYNVYFGFCCLGLDIY